MKKILTILLALCLVLTACSSSKQGGKNPSEPSRKKELGQETENEAGANDLKEEEKTLGDFSFTIYGDREILEQTKDGIDFIFVYPEDDPDDRYTLMVTKFNDDDDTGEMRYSYDTGLSLAAIREGFEEALEDSTYTKFDDGHIMNGLYKNPDGELRLIKSVFSQDQNLSIFYSGQEGEKFDETAEGAIKPLIQSLSVAEDKRFLEEPTSIDISKQIMNSSDLSQPYQYGEFLLTFPDNYLLQELQAGDGENYLIIASKHDGPAITGNLVVSDYEDDGSDPADINEYLLYSIESDQWTSTSPAEPLETKAGTSHIMTYESPDKKSKAVAMCVVGEKNILIAIITGENAAFDQWYEKEILPMLKATDLKK